jgi:hypothetical protein
MQARPTMVPYSPAKKPSPKVSVRAGERPRSRRYGCAGSSVSAKPNGLFLTSAGAAVPTCARAAPLWRSGWPPDGFDPGDGGFPRSAIDPGSTAFLARPSLIPWAIPGAVRPAILGRGLDAADRGQGVAGGPDRDRGPVPGLHAPDEIDQVAAVRGRAAAGVALPQPGPEVERAAGVPFLAAGVERAGDAHLVARAGRREAVVGEHVGAVAVGEFAQSGKVDPSIAVHVHRFRGDTIPRIAYA